MTWVLWALVVVVLGGCVVVASGRGGQLAEVYDDRPDVLVPGDRPLTADDLRAVRFTTAFRGYRMAEVDALIARLAAELDAVDLSGGAGSSAGTADDGAGTTRPPDEPATDDVTSFARREPRDGHAG